MSHTRRGLVCNSISKKRLEVKKGHGHFKCPEIDLELFYQTQIIKSKLSYKLSYKERYETLVMKIGNEDTLIIERHANWI